MIIYAVYIITTDGILMFNEVFQQEDKLPNEFILSGLLSSFKTISDELTNTYPETLVLGDVSYHFENFEDYFIVLITDSQEKPTALAFSLGMKFASKYSHHLVDWSGRTEIFDDFRPIVVKEASKYSNFDESGNIDPQQRLTAGEIIMLKPDLKPVATALISIEQGTIKDIQKELKSNDQSVSIKEIERELFELQKKGFVGFRTENKMRLYFI